MRSPSALTLTMLTLLGLAVSTPTFSASANAATLQAKPAQQARAAPAERRRLARGACGPIHASTADVVAALMSHSGGPLMVNGQRVCVDTAHPYYQWSDGSTSPAPPEGRGWRPAPALW